jgi:hypothetical protein
MSDNLRRYRAIRDALKYAYPTPPTGHFARHLNTLAALISGIVGGKSTQLPQIAAKVPDASMPESRVKRFSRWFDNDSIREEVYFLPYAEVLLRHVALQTVVLVMDGSGVGRGCCALMMHVISQGRALPLTWRVRQCPKGHWPEDLHIALVALVRTLIPEGTQVVFLGDGEFDGITLQETMKEAGWWYACRTSKAAPGKFEAKRFCSEKRVITRCDGTYCCIFVVLYMKEPSHADPSAPLSRGRPPNVGYGVETDERGPGLPSRSSGP